MFPPFKAQSKLADPMLQELGAHRAADDIGRSEANRGGSTEDTPRHSPQEGAELAHGCGAAELS